MLQYRGSSVRGGSFFMPFPLLEATRNTKLISVSPAAAGFVMKTKNALPASPYAVFASPEA
ncbi:MAG TPA: hypothetical protein DDW78_09120 [Treponema sp.]|nr:hypothetical protein [Treponema sp.]